MNITDVRNYKNHRFDGTLYSYMDKDQWIRKVKANKVR
jgi:hypothetical protein